MKMKMKHESIMDAAERIYEKRKANPERENRRQAELLRMHQTKPMYKWHTEVNEFTPRLS